MQNYMPQWPLKVLILSSDPSNADRLRLAQEQRDLQVAIRGTRSASSLNVSNEPSCRYSDITAALDRVDPHVLHFSGHGGKDILYFEDVQGSAKAVKKQALASVLSHQKELQLVILNACFSLNEGQGFADAVGLAIVSEGSILDEDAIDFSREFYTALGYGQRSYVESFERAKSALEMTGVMKVHLLRRETPEVKDGSPSSSLTPVSRPSRTSPRPELFTDPQANMGFQSRKDDDGEHYAESEAESLTRVRQATKEHDQVKLHKDPSSTQPAGSINNFSGTFNSGGGKIYSGNQFDSKGGPMNF